MTGCRHIVTITVALALSACTTNITSVRAGLPCAASFFTVTDNFVGARRGHCTVLSASHVRLTISPEDDGFINDSPWYAFKLTPDTAGTATVTLRYLGGHHRYVPKLSSDGLNWQAIDERNVRISKDGTQAELTLSLADATLWVSGQELVIPTIYDTWNHEIATHHGTSLRVLGTSKAGRPIHVLQTTSKTDDVLLLVGRQHPPEVSGAFAFFAFYEALAADTELARRFRDNVSIIAVPMMNPDGIVSGNWRHNLAGTDLNRDWGPFKQPETRLIRDLLDELDAGNRKVRVFLDFHSTKENVFYTQDENNPTNPPGFTKNWLSNSHKRIENYPFENKENPTDKVGVSKNYMYHRYGIPASTYEVGDETDRRAAQDAAQILAEELMLLMLAQDY